MDEENEEMAEIESVVERLQARDHNESLVRLAKDSGRKLFSQLDVEKRRNKISAMVSCLLSFDVSRVLRIEIPCSSPENLMLLKRAYPFFVFSSTKSTMLSELKLFDDTS